MVSIFGSENILTDSIHEGGNRGTDGKSNSSGDTRNDGCRVGFKDVLMRSLNAVECLDVLGRSLGVQVTLFRGRGGGRGGGGGETKCVFWVRGSRAIRKRK